MRDPGTITVVAVRLAALSIRSIGVDTAMFRTKLHVKVWDYQRDLGITCFSHAGRFRACISVTATALPGGPILWLVACDCMRRRCKWIAVLARHTPCTA